MPSQSQRRVQTRESLSPKEISAQLERFRQAVDRALIPYPKNPKEDSKTAVVPVQALESMLRYCPRCGLLGPVGRDFGLRNMGDGTVRPQAWCRECRAHPDLPPPHRTQRRG